MSDFIKTIASMLVAVFTFFGITVASDLDKPIDLQNGGDPFIVEDSGNTYYTFTTGGGVDIRKIESFNDTTLIEQKTVFWAGESGTTGAIWAPEIHKIGDRWYIIACAGFDKNVVDKGVMPDAKEFNDHDDYYRYSFILESNTEDIFGDYTFKGIIAPDGLNNIDGTYLQKDGRLYYICSAYRDVAKQSLYICEMENPYTLKTDENGRNNAVEISRPVHLWERRGWPVNEGPAVLYKGEDIYLFYSASGYSSGNYCMGMLTLKGDDVLSKKSWVKSPVSVLKHQPLKNIYNPGHCSFLYRENGDIYMVYHANSEMDFFTNPRLTYLRKVEFKCGVPCVKG